MWRRTTAERKAGLRASAAGHCEHADLNAARNVLAAAHAVFACGEPVLSDRSGEAGIRRTSGPAPPSRNLRPSGRGECHCSDSGTLRNPSASRI